MGGVSVAIVERLENRYLEHRYLNWCGIWAGPREVLVPHAYDPNGRDGEWHATIRLAHEILWHGEHAVPLFEGDLERIAWARVHPTPTATF